MISVRGDAVVIEYDRLAMDAALANDPRKSQVLAYKDDFDNIGHITICCCRSPRSCLFRHEMLRRSCMRRQIPPGKEKHVGKSGVVKKIRRKNVA